METVLTVGPRGPLDGVGNVVSCVQRCFTGDLLGGGGGGLLRNVSMFDHPLETPWSFSELDKSAHPLFNPG